VSIVKINPKALRPKIFPAALLDAEIVEVEPGYVAPWDEDNEGINWRFRIVDDNYPDFRGRFYSEFTTTTEGKPFSDRAVKFCRGLDVPQNEDGTYDLDPDALEDTKVTIEMGTYWSKKHEEDRNTIRSLIRR
jgi:hypothetical protein